ncbi:uncharacterized protein [Diadema setosum]|uniref:uncharacterized protein n=1 Tax=Diadema setosum TaxID=31175 RepID=UPI003B3B30D5
MGCQLSKTALFPSIGHRDGKQPKRRRRRIWSGRLPFTNRNLVRPIHLIQDEPRSIVPSPSPRPELRASSLRMPATAIPTPLASSAKPAAHICEWVASVDARIEESTRVKGSSYGSATAVEEKTYSQGDVDDAIERILNHVATDVLTFDHSGPGVTTTYQANPIPDIPGTVVSPVDDVRPPVGPLYPSRDRTKAEPSYKPRRSFHYPEEVDGNRTSCQNPDFVLRNGRSQMQNNHGNEMTRIARHPIQAQKHKQEERWATRRTFF